MCHSLHHRVTRPLEIGLRVKVFVNVLGWIGIVNKLSTGTVIAFAKAWITVSVGFATPVSIRLM